MMTEEKPTERKAIEEKVCEENARLDTLEKKMESDAAKEEGKCEDDDMEDGEIVDDDDEDENVVISSTSATTAPKANLPCLLQMELPVPDTLIDFNSAGSFKRKSMNMAPHSNKRAKPSPNYCDELMDRDDLPPNQNRMSRNNNLERKALKKTLLPDPPEAVVRSIRCELGLENDDDEEIGRQFKTRRDRRDRDRDRERDWNGRPNRNEKSNNKSKEICKYYATGDCFRGADCPFLHTRKARKQELCKFYLNDCCQKWDYCNYLHEEFPCKYFHLQMGCYKGDNCKFSHDKLTNNTRTMLVRYLEKFEPEINKQMLQRLKYPDMADQQEEEEDIEAEALRLYEELERSKARMKEQEEKRNSHNSYNARGSHNSHNSYDSQMPEPSQHCEDVDYRKEFNQAFYNECGVEQQNYDKFPANSQYNPEKKETGATEPGNLHNFNGYPPHPFYPPDAQSDAKNQDFNMKGPRVSPNHQEYPPDNRQKNSRYCGYPPDQYNATNADFNSKGPRVSPNHQGYPPDHRERDLQYRGYPPDIKDNAKDQDLNNKGPRGSSNEWGYPPDTRQKDPRYRGYPPDNTQDNEKYQDSNRNGPRISPSHPDNRQNDPRYRVYLPDNTQDNEKYQDSNRNGPRISPSHPDNRQNDPRYRVYPLDRPNQFRNDKQHREYPDNNRRNNNAQFQDYPGPPPYPDNNIPQNEPRAGNHLSGNHPKTYQGNESYQRYPSEGRRMDAQPYTDTDERRDRHLDTGYSADNKSNFFPNQKYPGENAEIKSDPRPYGSMKLDINIIQAQQTQPGIHFKKDNSELGGTRDSQSSIRQSEQDNISSERREMQDDANTQGDDDNKKNLIFKPGLGIRFGLQHREAFKRAELARIAKERETASKKNDWFPSSPGEGRAVTPMPSPNSGNQEEESDTDLIIALDTVKDPNMDKDGASEEGPSEIDKSLERHHKEKRVKSHKRDKRSRRHKGEKDASARYDEKTLVIGEHDENEPSSQVSAKEDRLHHRHSKKGSKSRHRDRDEKYRGDKKSSHDHDERKRDDRRSHHSGDIKNKQQSPDREEKSKDEKSGEEPDDTKESSDGDVRQKKSKRKKNASSPTHSTEDETVSHLPKTQQRLYSRIKLIQQKYGEKKDNKVDDSGSDKATEANWYSSDEEDPGSTENVRADEQPNLEQIPLPECKTPESSNELSSIKITEEVSKLLDSIRVRNVPKSKSPPSSSPTSLPLQLQSFATFLSLSNANASNDNPADVDLRVPSTSSIPSFTPPLPPDDPPEEMEDDESVDTDLRDLPFKPIPAHDSANEIDASLTSHPPILYKLIPLNLNVKRDFTSIRDKGAHHALDPRIKALPPKTDPPPVTTSQSLTTPSTSLAKSTTNKDPRKCRVENRAPPTFATATTTTMPTVPIMPPLNYSIPMMPGMMGMPALPGMPGMPPLPPMPAMGGIMPDAFAGLYPLRMMNPPETKNESASSRDPRLKSSQNDPRLRKNLSQAPNFTSLLPPSQNNDVDLRVNCGPYQFAQSNT